MEDWHDYMDDSGKVYRVTPTPADSPNELDRILSAEGLPHNALQLATFKSKLERYILGRDRRRDAEHLARLLEAVDRLKGSYDSAMGSIIPMLDPDKITAAIRELYEVKGD